MKYYFLIIYLTLNHVNILFAQTDNKFLTEKDSTYYATYNKLKEMHVKIILSPQFQAHKAMVEDYNRKLKQSPDYEYSNEDQGALSWLKDNWQSTGFKSYEEAKKEHLAIDGLWKNITKTNAEVYKFSAEAEQKYGNDIFLSVMKDIMYEHPGKFLPSYSASVNTSGYPENKSSGDTDRGYAVAYNRLKDLFVIKMMSPEYQIKRNMFNEYKRKLKKSPDYAFSKDDMGALKWLKDNWQSTGFTSHEEAEKDFEAIMEQYKIIEKKYPEFGDYSTEAVLKYGADIIINVIIDIKREYPDKY